MRLIDADEIPYFIQSDGSVVAYAADIDQLPTIQQQTGKWIVTSRFDDCYYARCNKCKVAQVFYNEKPLTNFCPNCGAEMTDEVTK